MLFLIIYLASFEILYFSRISPGFFINRFLNSGSLAALSRMSLIISASFCREIKINEKNNEVLYNLNVELVKLIRTLINTFFSIDISKSKKMDAEWNISSNPSREYSKPYFRDK